MAPFHSAPSVAVHAAFQNAPAHINAQIVGQHSGPLAELNITEEWDETDWDYIPYTRRDYPRIPHPTVCWHTSKEYTSKRTVALPLQPPYIDPSRWATEPEETAGNMGKWNKCHLLSLPKELRLMIWKYVLTDPSVPNTTVEITRQPLSPSKSSLRFPNPHIRSTLLPARNSPINLNILLVNRLVYKEALPILYRSIKFAPLDLEGLFPLFLESLSPESRPLIRQVKLRVPASIFDIDLFGDPSTSLFHWAVTCAQVAKLENLRNVEVEGFFPDLGTKSVRKGILNPLCKIKAKKSFGVDDDQVAQQLLAKAEQELKAQAAVRQERTRAEALERAERDELLRQQAMQQELERKQARSSQTIDDIAVENGLKRVKGIMQFQKELEEHTQSAFEPADPFEDETDTETGDWDIVSYRSGTPTPKVRAASIVSVDSDEPWIDTASTILGQDEFGEDSNKLDTDSALEHL